MAAGVLVDIREAGGPGADELVEPVGWRFGETRTSMDGGEQWDVLLRLGLLATYVTAALLGLFCLALAIRHALR